MPDLSQSPRLAHFHPAVLRLPPVQAPACDPVPPTQFVGGYPRQVRNWHKLDWDSEEQINKRRSVDKRGALSDEAYVREVLGEMHSAENLLVINDEAHHAWRVPPKVKIAGISKDELKEATKWVGGLDRIYRARGILMCYDLTATPFAS